MRRVLLIDRLDNEAVQLKAALRQNGFEASLENKRWKAIQLLRRRVPEWDFVVVFARCDPEEQFIPFRDLVEASQQLHHSDRPEFLFVSCARCPISLRLRIASIGARFVYL